ncbi:MAG TPA: hypothetical protein DEA87_01005 [Candidatus Veblenbacteria bacterium]|uniref:Uncharacterized protein n=2 Tax=Candidatus Vebleniibacteriota TaxID=1817921 RepID=A0A1G2Q6E2_9BACT|nr:MAG: hypothetical protein A2226_02690 [Candidatus Veblenbacteria bacterium RIFOXYA2_FULL_43_9]OHA57354.1 MAG: hypothetical protein A2441_00915 [Candidatus Veblenbacteria bacterium RIFOXYC2_FULL_42_11]HAO81441.1 hypothetical protein [Candidatus Veblenbacteria bacterium]HBT92046.1 hypothetical protein [Candidatus Veblenbacteria bacterium]
MANKFETPSQLNDKLSPDEAADLVEQIGDPRLSIDLNNKEYFCISLPGGNRFIPRLKNIPWANKNGSVSYIHIEMFLRATLKAIDDYSSLNDKEKQDLIS